MPGTELPPLGDIHPVAKLQIATLERKVVDLEEAIKVQTATNIRLDIIIDQQRVMLSDLTERITCIEKEPKEKWDDLNKSLRNAIVGLIGLLFTTLITIVAIAIKWFEG